MTCIVRPGRALTITVAQVIPDSIACRLYLLTVLLETAVDLAMEAELFLRLKDTNAIDNTDNQQSEKMPVYLSIFAMAQYVHD